jgi:hypothetical protein
MATKKPEIVDYSKIKRGVNYQWVNGKLVEALPADIVGPPKPVTSATRVQGGTPLIGETKMPPKSIPGVSASQPTIDKLVENLRRIPGGGPAVGAPIASNADNLLSTLLGGQDNSGILTRGAAERAPGTPAGGFIPAYEAPGESFPSSSGGFGGGGGGGGGGSAPSPTRTSAITDLDRYQAEQQLAAMTLADRLAQSAAQQSQQYTTQNLEKVLGFEKEEASAKYSRLKELLSPLLKQVEQPTEITPSAEIESALRLEQADALAQMNSELARRGIVRSGPGAEAVSKLLATSAAKIAEAKTALKESAAERATKTQQNALASILSAFSGALA